MQKRIILIGLNFLFFTFHSFGFSQNSETDSLLSILKAAKEDSMKVNVLNDLFFQYEYTDDEKAKEFLNNAMELSQKINYQKGLAKTYTSFGFFSEDKGNYQEALKYHLASLKIMKEIHDKDGEANAFNNIGLVYSEQGNYYEALKNHLLSLKISEQLNDKHGITDSYNNIAGIYLQQGNYPEALKDYSECLKIYKELGDKEGIAYSINNMGLVYYHQGKYSEALKNYFASLKIKKAIGDKKTEAASYNNIGLVYYDQGNYPEALKNYFISLKISEVIGDKKGIAFSYNNIGGVYYAQNNYPDALKNYLASLKISEVAADKSGIADSYNNIGNVYSDQGNYSEALKNHKEALKIRVEIGDKFGISESYNNIGIVYLTEVEREKDPSICKNKLEEALRNFLVSLKSKEEIGDKASIASSYRNIGNVYTKQKKYKLAEEFLFKAKKLSKEIGYKESLREVYKSLAKLDSAKGNFKEAFFNHKLYILYYDSLNNEETRKKTIQSQMTFDFEKKESIASAEHKKELENQQALAEEKSRKQKLVLFFVVGSLFFVLLFAVFIFRSLHITRKQKNIIELQKKRVEQQKKEVEYQKLLVEEHQKEIIDSITYAKRLQQAILPSDEEIKKYLPHNFILYKPKDIVAGDFYWMHTSSNEELVFIAAADSTGHGVPGAMVSVVCSNALNRAVNEFNLIETGKILDKTRELVLETFAKSGEEIKDGMDISLLRLKFEIQNTELLEVQWSGANNPLWYTQQILNLKDEAIDSTQRWDVIFHEIKPDKQSIGKTDNAQPFTTHKIELNKGNVFYLMTDGYADQFGGEKGKKYKYKQLQEKLVAISNSSLAEQKEELTRSFDEWKGNLEQVDDVTIIGIKI